MEGRNRLQGSTQEQGSERTDEVINDTNREGFRFEVPKCFPSTEYVWDFLDDKELHEKLDLCKEYDHDSEDIVFIVNFKTKTIHHVLYPLGSCGVNKEPNPINR